MLETYNNGSIIVRDYTDIYSVHDYINNALIPKYFPNIPIAKLKMGLPGLVSEYIGNAVEDSYYTSSLMLNENFITKAILPDSIYAEAALFDLGYTFATPSKCNFALQLYADDILKYSTVRPGTAIFDYRLDKDTKVIIGDNIYRLDYDIIISYQMMNGRPVFEVQYDMETTNSIAITQRRFIKNQLSNNGWLILYVTLQEFERVIIEEPISDNTITTASDITINWDNQLAGFDVVYITPSGERLPMKKKILYSRPDVEPYIFYTFSDDNVIRCSFTEVRNYFSPAFNSTIEFTLYTCHGRTSNFDAYDGQGEVIVEKTGLNYEYNVDTHIVAVCYSGSLGGTNRKGLEMLRDDVTLAYNTAHVLSTDHDLDVWFNNFAKRYDTKAYFFKRRDDPSGRLFSMFVAMTDDSYIYPTNTLTMEVRQQQFDFVNGDNEFVLKPGHLWKYKPGSRDTVVPLGTDATTSISAPAGDGKLMVTDPEIPVISTSDPNVDERFMFVNPFYTKISRMPGISMCYNYMIHETSAPSETYQNPNQFLLFQVLQMTVDRSISKEYPNSYILTAQVAPVVEESAVGMDYKYIYDTYENNQDLYRNNMRVLMVTRTKMHGDTGYVEMRPTRIDPGGFIEFEAVITVDDNLKNDGTLEISTDGTGMHSLIMSGPPPVIGHVFIDAMESQFNFMVLIRTENPPADPVFNDSSFLDPVTGANAYTIANVFANDFRTLHLYKPMGMMRSVLEFSGAAGGYLVKAELMPFIKYDIPLDKEKMSYFIEAFNSQYAAAEPVLFERLDNNCHLDMKFFNTYGKSNNYYYGDTEELLDSVNIAIYFDVAMIDRSSFLVTYNSMINQIQDFFTTLNDAKVGTIYISQLIQRLENENPNLDHLRYLGIDQKIDTMNQVLPWSIRARYESIAAANLVARETMKRYVPELIQCLREDIHLTEEKQIRS